MCLHNVSLISNSFLLYVALSFLLFLMSVVTVKDEDDQHELQAKTFLSNESEWKHLYAGFLHQSPVNVQYDADEIYITCSQNLSLTTDLHLMKVKVMTGERCYLSDTVNQPNVFVFRDVHIHLQLFIQLLKNVNLFQTQKLKRLTEMKYLHSRCKYLHIIFSASEYTSVLVF